MSRPSFGSVDRATERESALVVGSRGAIVWRFRIQLHHHAVPTQGREEE